MSIVPGKPLAGSQTPAQVNGLATAVTTLWAIPHSLTDIEPWHDDLRFARQLTTDHDQPAVPPRRHMTPLPPGGTAQIRPC